MECTGDGANRNWRIVARNFFTSDLLPFETVFNPSFYDSGICFLVLGSYREWDPITKGQ